MSDRLDASVEEIRLDQYVVDDALKHFNFDLAAKLVSLYVESGGSRFSSAVAPTAEAMRETAAKIVRQVLELGREAGPNASVSSLFMTATYRIFEDTLETVELELHTVSSHAMRPKKKYLRDVRGYINAMGGGELDEEGRWHPGASTADGGKAT